MIVTFLICGLNQSINQSNYIKQNPTQMNHRNLECWRVRGRASQAAPEVFRKTRRRVAGQLRLVVSWWTSKMWLIPGRTRHSACGTHRLLPSTAATPPRFRNPGGAPADSSPPAPVLGEKCSWDVLTILGALSSHDLNVFGQLECPGLLEYL